MAAVVGGSGAPDPTFRAVACVDDANFSRSSEEPELRQIEDNCDLVSNGRSCTTDEDCGAGRCLGGATGDGGAGGTCHVYTAAGWPVGVCPARCANITLITPNRAIMSRTWARRLSAESRAQVRGQVHLAFGPDVFGDSRLRFDPAGGRPDMIVSPTLCREIRRSGMAECCAHPRYRRGDRRGQPWFPPPGWDLEASYPDDVIQSDSGVPAPSETYARYLETCAEPLAPDDEVISDLAILDLPERIARAGETTDPRFDFEPLPLAWTFPDGTADLAYWTTEPRPRGEAVGYGSSAPCASGQLLGTRNVAAGATTLAPDSDVVLVTGDGTRIVLADGTLAGDRTAPGFGKLDYAGPLLMRFPPDRLRSDGRRIVATYGPSGAVAGGFCDNFFETHLHPDRWPSLRDFLDPDGDEIPRGYVDARELGVLRPGYVDLDGDGMSEHRVVPRSEGGARCVEAVPPLTDRCWLATDNDNCSPPPEGRWAYDYHNRDQRDADGDGRGDACDACPETFEASHDLSDPTLFCAASFDWIPQRTPERTAPIATGDPVSIVCARSIQDKASTPAFDESDRDADGVLDLCDNCAPPVVEEDGAAEAVPFANADQLDRDGDGFGDHCDLCPPSMCEAQERPIAQCANPVASYGGGGQPRQDARDADRDEVPEACDNCLGVDNPDQRDEDGDGLGTPATTAPATPTWTSRTATSTRSASSGARRPGTCAIRRRARGRR